MLSAFWANSGQSRAAIYKAEGIRQRAPWRSMEAVEFAILEWVGWFNNRRPLEPIGSIRPRAKQPTAMAT